MERDTDLAGLAEFSDADELLVWCVRSLIAQRGAWPEVRAELRRRCSLITCEAAAHALGRMLDRIGATSPRDLYLHQPHCPCLGEDEVALLGLVARVQRGDGPGARAAARRLVPESDVALLIADAGMLGDVLAVKDLHVS